MKAMSVVLAIAVCLLVLGCGDDDDGGKIFNPVDMEYNLEFSPSDFASTGLTGNTYFPMVPGTTQIYEGEEEDGVTIRVVSEILDSTKVVAGVTCAVFRVTEYEDGELTEQTRDWYAQDLEGNVWYFGEFVINYDNGAFENNDGSWEAGVDGALPGLFMLANPIVGLWYRQEYRPGEAEDVAQIQEAGLTVTVGGTTYQLDEP